MDLDILIRLVFHVKRRVVVLFCLMKRVFK